VKETLSETILGKLRPARPKFSWPGVRRGGRWQRTFHRTDPL